MKKRKHRTNDFGFSGKSPREQHDGFFWQAKEDKKLRRDQKRADINQQIANTEAVQALVNNPVGLQSNIASTGGNLWVVVIIAVVGIGAYLALRGKKPKESEADPSKLTTEELIV